jgi:hypothetical protein
MALAGNHIHDEARAAGARTRYVIVHRDNAWRIAYAGRCFGPYSSVREALLFAVDAAHALGTRGRSTEVLLLDEDGEPRPQWIFGRDPYPPRPDIRR